MELKTIVMMGRPGSGKGTQARLLAEATGFELFSTGKRTREIADLDTFFGRKLKEVTEAGLLIPHWIASFYFEELLLSRPQEHGVIFDGTCRTLPEAELFDEMNAWLERPYQIIYLDVSEEAVISRLEKRRSEGRKDDSSPSIEKRMEEFKNETEPALAFLRMRKKGRVLEIPGEGDPQAIFAEIRSRLALL
jgi:adenylate kinase